MEDHKTIPGSEPATSRDLICSEASTATPWLSDNNTVPLCSPWQVGRQGSTLSGPRIKRNQPATSGAISGMFLRSCEHCQRQKKSEMG